MKLHRTTGGVRLEHDDAFFALPEAWDTLINHPQLANYLTGIAASGGGAPALDAAVLAPIDGQDVWAAGVTYVRSRSARMEESHGTGAEAFYDAVYDAPRPELFFKASPWRVRGPGQPVRIRRDARWSVPEPELALCINASGAIVGWTIGNDMSARDIEGENPLYLPQAKIYDGACAIGPALLVREAPLPSDTVIAIAIHRDGQVVFQSETTLSQMRRTQEELVEHLYRETSFPAGCMLLTGTGIVPPADFTLVRGDQVAIHVGPIGSLVNTVE